MQAAGEGEADGRAESAQSGLSAPAIQIATSRPNLVCLSLPFSVSGAVGELSAARSCPGPGERRQAVLEQLEQQQSAAATAAAEPTALAATIEQYVGVKQ